MRESALAKLRNRVRGVVAEALVEGGKTTNQLVLLVKDQCPAEVNDAAEELISDSLRKMVQTACKSSGNGNREQLVLPLILRDVDLPPAISVPAPSQNEEIEEIKWVSLRYATLEDLDRHIGLLEEGIRADSKKRDNICSLRNYVAPAMRGYPAKTISEALRELDDGRGDE